MGQTNRETLGNLLDKIQDETDSTTKTDTGQTSSTPTSHSRLLEIEKTSRKHTDYNTNWTPVPTGKIADKVKRKATENDIEIPCSATPSPREIGRFMPVVKGWPEITKPGLGTTDLSSSSHSISITELTDNHRTFIKNGGELDKIKLVASLLDDHNIVWAVTEMFIRYSDDWTDEHIPFIEVGVPNNSQNHEEEFLQAMKQSYNTVASREQLPYLNSTVTKNGYSFYPLHSNYWMNVMHPGVMNRDEHQTTGTNITGYQHKGIIKDSL